jgi:hypothetical protein
MWGDLVCLRHSHLFIFMISPSIDVVQLRSTYEDISENLWLLITIVVARNMWVLWGDRDDGVTECAVGDSR